MWLSACKTFGDLRQGLDFDFMTWAVKYLASAFVFFGWRHPLTDGKKQNPVSTVPKYLTANSSVVMKVDEM